MNLDGAKQYLHQKQSPPNQSSNQNRKCKMSSFSKNLIPRRIHKERSQPELRVAKHGLLEKKRDYKLRAKDRNRKLLRLKLLKEKAAFRNRDEFYYGMINAKTDDGRVRKTLNLNEKNALPIAHRDREQRLLAETQDSAYVDMKLRAEMAKVERLRRGLHFNVDKQETKRKHIRFVDTEEEQEKVVDELKRKDEGKQEGKYSARMQRALDRLKAKSYQQLQLHDQRKQKLLNVYQDIQVEKNLLQKGRRVMKTPPNKETGAPPVYRWLQERKR